MAVFGNLISGRIIINGKEVKPEDLGPKCSCGNRTNWKSITQTNDKTVAECGSCGNTVRS